MTKAKSKEKLNVAVIGYGCRGRDMLKLILEMDDINVIGVCDVYPDRMKDAAKAVTDAGKKAPLAVTDYRRLLELPELEAVYTPSSWTSHVQICLDAMDCGKYVGPEVGGATSVQQCWELVRMSEKTKIPCMLMENCCYGRVEMMILNLVKKGMFGECVHAEGGYRHDLRDEVNLGEKNRHYRLQNYTSRGGDVYPTHDLGPIAKFLDLNRGNRMVSLTSMSCKSRGLNAWREMNMSGAAPVDFRLGDVISTTIKCARGETINLFHDTSLPRPYSRCGVLQGTKGIWSEDRRGLYFEGSKRPHCWDPLDDYFKKYEHPLWKKFLKKGINAGHGGMDYLILRAFFEAAMQHAPTPIDVYDTASWMAITPLSEQSADMGGMPVPVPDFTDGKWFTRKDIRKGPYSLDEIVPSAYKNMMI